MTPHEETRIGDVRTTAEYVARMRRLKESSGLTFRQLEQRAAGEGRFLARSTLSDALRRGALPRQDVIEAFVRACGGDRERAQEWVRAAERLGKDPARPQESADGADGRPSSGLPAASGPGGSVRRRAALLLAGALGISLLALGVRGLLSPRTDGRASARPPAAAGAKAGAGEDAGAGAAAGAPSPGWSRIRPVRSPALCVTEGRERGGDPNRAVAVQRACSGAVPPRTRLARAGDGAFFVVWRHPQLGDGCLTVIGGGLLEPWEDCRKDRLAQVFRIEPARDAGPGRYLLHPEYSGRCLGVRGDGRDAGAEIVEEQCTGRDDQLFVIEAG
ncbi:RICIN domain-containing protein [Streptomyces sp. HB2AG]|uniref:RICIN domain-containing protein n=1 Tax=Streptomyces sp. HB2AG TaxID=2983400 RepID=UPI0022AB1BB1|nr:XRE family transcriptional regulator [Streptomyces sp. HB2AG]MCZ2525841.1 XRE family transcriptional regulator [Streptomyces sp. HB2AG]